METGSQLCFEDSPDRFIAIFCFEDKASKPIANFVLKTNRQRSQGIEAPSRSLKRILCYLKCPVYDIFSL